ncbi:MAG: hypothetical protein FJ146_12550 [Deltaproteobacteria bacterium]|nr:hypothetical protein [Deltaproteobacteria bacterium]
MFIATKRSRTTNAQSSSRRQSIRSALVVAALAMGTLACGQAEDSALDSVSEILSFDNLVQLFTEMRKGISPEEMAKIDAAPLFEDLNATIRNLPTTQVKIAGAVIKNSRAFATQNATILKQYAARFQTIGALRASAGGKEKALSPAQLAAGFQQAMNLAAFLESNGGALQLDDTEGLSLLAAKASTIPNINKACRENISALALLAQDPRAVDCPAMALPDRTRNCTPRGRKWNLPSAIVSQECPKGKFTFNWRTRKITHYEPAPENNGENSGSDNSSYGTSQGGAQSHAEAGANGAWASAQGGKASAKTSGRGGNFKSQSCYNPNGGCTAEASSP